MKQPVMKNPVNCPNCNNIVILEQISSEFTPSIVCRKCLVLVYWDNFLSLGEKPQIKFAKSGYKNLKEYEEYREKNKWFHEE